MGVLVPTGIVAESGAFGSRRAPTRPEDARARVRYPRRMAANADIEARTQELGRALIEAAYGEDSEPRCHHGPEETADCAGPAALEAEQERENDQGQRDY